jgi:predicted phosphodiesterase
MMRVVVMSDTHGHQPPVPDSDLLLHAGDVCEHGTLAEIARFSAWFGSLPHPFKIVIAGNHDWPFERNRQAAEDVLGPGITYMQDRGGTVRCRGEQLRLYGTPWQPEFCGWAFNLPRNSSALRLIWSKVPEGLDILITHGPPAGVLDRTAYGEQAGCQLLAEQVAKVKPRLHVFGHIHPGAGIVERDGTVFCNASVCNEQYKPVNPVRVFEVTNDSVTAV